jgi:hypothetical protein
VVVDHICGHRWCVRPSHLEAVSAQENVRRAQRRASPRPRRATCSRGHALEGDNVMLVTCTYRRCRVCTNEKSRRHQQSKRQSAATNRHRR